MLRVLHVWDKAGVGAVLAKFQRKIGFESSCVYRKGVFGASSVFGIQQFYGCAILSVSAIKFYWEVLKKTRGFNIIHFHGCYRLAPLVKLLFRKKVVFHFHGSELRDSRTRFRFLRWFADKVLVSTPDLVNCLPDAEWLPNPVDTEHFKKTVNQKRKGFVEFQNGDGKYRELVPYRELPEYLGQFRKFRQLEWKVQGLSKLSLECLACGLTVFWNGLEIKGQLPPRHEALNVAKRTIQIYENISK